MTTESTAARPGDWRPQLRTTRMEAFSDGVFAIAITLLVLEIGVEESEESLARAVLELWPSYVAYVSSFLTIGAVWLAHSTITQFLRGVDSLFLRLNLVLLMVCSFLPFPSKLLAGSMTDTEDARVAAPLYGAVLLALAVLVSLLWRHALRAGLVDTAADGLNVRLLTRRLQPATSFYLAAIALGVVVPRVAVLLYPTIAVFVLVPIASIRRSAGARGRRSVRLHAETPTEGPRP